MNNKRATIGVIIAALLLTSIPLAYSQLSRVQYATASITPTETTTITNVDLGSLTGGVQSTQTFNDVVGFTMTSGTHTASASITVNDTLWQSVQVYILNSGGQECQLQGGSGISAISTCTWSVSGNVEYSETWIVIPNDGYAVSSTDIPIAFALS